MRDDKTKGPFGNNLVFSFYLFIYILFLVKKSLWGEETTPSQGQGIPRPL